MRRMTEAHLAVLRRHMVEAIAIQVELASDELGKAALDPRAMAAMAQVPRHRFVPAPLAPLANQCQIRTLPKQANAFAEGREC